MQYDETAMLRQCHPMFKSVLLRILADLRNQGWQPKIVYVKRTEAEQAEKVKQGYSRTMHSWHLESTIGVLPTVHGGFDIVRGNAADVVDARYGWGGQAARLDFPFWKALGATAKKYGCTWGGEWKSFKDVAHVQMLYIEETPRHQALV